MCDEKKIIGKPFLPGQSGNLSGRPKRRLVDKALEVQLLTNDSEKATQLAAVLLEKALRGNLDAAKLVLDRVEGRALQRTELSGPDAGPLAFANMTDEQLDARIDELVLKRAEEAK